ncbi:preprotein translocase subunit SecG [Carboxylicivirga sp. N1Y90]|uniref:preprotein translocase subunit SecG n=1 Tax=Carboxylicivirga fragile TaxID=3417571 RepID=UPI003D345537|nr:preprotein translocase subunit SecG [Marinilabiliaceae bacterium N1Y90]
MSFITILIVLVSVFLILIVLVQNSKGGGLASNFSASNQVMGVRKTTDFLEKATWTSAGALLILCFVAVMFVDKGTIGAAEIDEKVNALPTQQEMPAFPTPAQGEQTEGDATEDGE